MGQLTSCKYHSSKSIRKNHLHSYCHVFPRTQVVTSPHRRKALGTGVVGTGEHKRTFGRVRAVVECVISLVGLMKGAIRAKPKESGSRRTKSMPLMLCTSRCSHPP